MESFILLPHYLAMCQKMIVDKRNLSRTSKIYFKWSLPCEGIYCNQLSDLTKEMWLKSICVKYLVYLISSLHLWPNFSRSLIYKVSNGKRLFLREIVDLHLFYLFPVRFFLNTNPHTSPTHACEKGVHVGEPLFSNLYLYYYSSKVLWRILLSCCVFLPCLRMQVHKVCYILSFTY